MPTRGGARDSQPRFSDKFSFQTNLVDNIEGGFPMFRAASRGVLFCLLLAALPGMSPAQSSPSICPCKASRLRSHKPSGLPTSPSSITGRW